MSKLTNENILENIEADFDSFLSQGKYDQCNVIIDNLRDLGKYEKGIELAKRLCAAKLRVPADYGEKSPMEAVTKQINMINKALYGVEPFKESDEEIF